MERIAVATPTLMHIVRLGFVLVSMFMGVSIVMGDENREWWVGSLWGLVFAAVFVGLEISLRDFSFRRFSHATIGLLMGLLGGWLITRIGFFKTKGLVDYEAAQSIFELATYLGLGFFGIMLALRANREEFSLLIPYVRFRQDSVHDQPLLVDTNVIIDGRIPRICEAGFLTGTMIVPRFVMDELQLLADSRDEIRQERGKRGLEILSQMRQAPNLDITIHEDSQPGEKLVDSKLVGLAKLIGARLLTNDINLGKVARVQGVAVLSLNDLAQAMRPVVVPGDELRLNLVKEGKDDHQAVGYLPDGTMIVVNHAIDFLGESQEVVVAGAVQTSAGRLIFAELKDSPRAEKYLVTKG